MLSRQSKEALVRGVDANSASHGMGVLVLDDEGPYWLRRLPDAYTSTVLFRVMYQNQETGLGTEVVSLTLNAAGTACAWVGTFAFSAAAPVSGGASAPLAYVSAAAAGAGTVQTFASGVRVYNELSGNHAANAAQDNDPYYQWTMRSCDVLQLVSAAGGVRTAMKTADALGKAQIPLGRAAMKGMTRPEARRFAGGAFKTFQGAGTAQAVRQQIVGSISSMLSGISSISGGVIKEVAVGIVGTPSAPPTTTQEFVGPRQTR